MEISTDDKPTRGRLITAWLIFNAALYIFLVGVFVVALANPEASDMSVPSSDQWAVILLMISSIIDIGAIIAIWRWRKFGLYVFVSMSLPALIAHVGLHSQFFTAIFPLTNAGIMWMVLQSRWKYFY